VGVREKQKWITGEEFGAQRRRLMEAGVQHNSPEMKALFDRVAERDDALWELYAPKLIDTHPGQWAAISTEGDWIICRTSSEASAAGRERFGPGNFAFGRLAPFRGHQM
jgi:hypothetical protein